MTDSKPAKIQLHHSSDEKAKTTVTEDALQAYLDSGWVRTEKAEPSK